MTSWGSFKRAWGRCRLGSITFTFNDRINPSRSPSVSPLAFRRKWGSFRWTLNRDQIPAVNYSSEEARMNKDYLIGVNWLCCQLQGAVGGPSEASQMSLVYSSNGPSILMIWWMLASFLQVMDKHSAGKDTCFNSSLVIFPCQVQPLSNARLRWKFQKQISNLLFSSSSINIDHYIQSFPADDERMGVVE